MRIEVHRVEITATPAMVVFSLQTPKEGSELFSTAKISPPGCWLTASRPIIDKETVWSEAPGATELGVQLFPYNVSDGFGILAGFDLLDVLLANLPDRPVERLLIFCGEDKRQDIRRNQWVGFAVWTP